MIVRSQTYNVLVRLPRATHSGLLGYLVCSRVSTCPALQEAQDTLDVPSLSIILCIVVTQAQQGPMVQSEQKLGPLS